MGFSSKIAFGFWLIAVQVFACGVLSAADFRVRDFGAAGDGATLDTRAIQQAVDQCSETGGRVILSDGKFLSGTLYLKDGVTLVIDKSAVLLGSTDIADYPHNRVDFRFYGDTWVSQALIVAHNVKNVGLDGEGTIDGQGAAFVQTTKVKPDRYKNRPYLLWFAGCDGVRVRNVHLQNSAMWMQSYICCNDLRIEDISVFNHANYNNDMLDIDGCRDVVICGVVGDVDDDGITFKSTTDRISENITVSDCILSSHCNALKFGTETTAGFRNVTVTNCVIRPSTVHTTFYGHPEGTCGLALEVVDGGILENVTVSNLVIDGPRTPLFIRLGNRARKYFDGAPEPGPGSMKNILISGITARASGTIGCSVTGVPEARIEGITISDCRFVTPGGGSYDGIPVPENETMYPESDMFGPLPSFGLYVRHAGDVKLDNIVFTALETEHRPALVFDDVRDSVVSGIEVRGNAPDILRQADSCVNVEHKK